VFKCNPEKFGELVEQDGISPAPYVGRYKWVSLQRLDVLPWSELKDLLEQSYGMVAAKAKVRRPARAKAPKPRRAGKRKSSKKS
jgi:predicted DNA-binding protein (MmcQ/YjbR family)